MLEALREELDIEFEAASTFVAMHVSESNFTDAIKLKLYGLFKQATVGPCDAPKPGMFDLKGKSKWYTNSSRTSHVHINDPSWSLEPSPFYALSLSAYCSRSAWKELGSMAQEDAMVRYIETVASVQPEWKTMGGGRRGGESGCVHVLLPPLFPFAVSDAHSPSSLTYTLPSIVHTTPMHERFPRGPMGPVISTLAGNASAEGAGGDAYAQESLLGAAARGDLAALDAALRSGAPVNEPDGGGCCALHWAADQGHVRAVERLVEHGAGADSLCRLLFLYTENDSENAPIQKHLAFKVQNTKSARFYLLTKYKERKVLPT